MPNVTGKNGVASAIPSIVKVLGTEDLERVRFLMPSVGSGITTLNNKAVRPPGMKEMVVLLLNLREQTAVPFRFHLVREKMYLLQSEGVVDVFVHTHHKTHRVRLDEIGQYAEIPAGAPHALHCRETGGKPSCGLFVISTMFDSRDVVWEEAAEKLITNQHLRKKVI